MTRGEAIRILKNDEGYDVISPDANIAIKLAIRSLEAQQWIPCSERLPEEEGEYLVTVYCTENIIWVDKFEYFITSDGWVDPSNAIDWNGYVIAWIPLPQPWKEVEDEQIH